MDVSKIHSYKYKLVLLAALHGLDYDGDRGISWIYMARVLTADWWLGSRWHGMMTTGFWELPTRHRRRLPVSSLNPASNRSA